MRDKKIRKLERSKYNNIKSGGYDSRKEADFAEILETLKHAHDPAVKVVKIDKQVRYNLIPSVRGLDGKIIERKCDYIADFVVTRASGKVDVIDVKGYKTPEYIIKRKLMLQVHGIRISEV